MDSAFLRFNKDFETFGSQHLLVLFLMLALSVGMPVLAKRNLSYTKQLLVSRIMSVCISFWAILYVVLLIYLDKFNYKTDLPLDLCNLAAVLLPFVMWKPNFRVHEVLYFIVLAGTLQANITPHLYNGFPNFIFIKYWVVHSGLIVFVIYNTVVFNLKPTIRSLWKAFLVLQAYIVFIYLFNLLIGSNYVYVVEKPPTASALDYLGPWPWYILISELICGILFFIVYIPIHLSKRQEK